MSTCRGPREARALVVTVVMVCAAATAALAQRFDFTYDPRVSNVPYNGPFVLARLKYNVGPGGYYYYGMPAWAHGYPRAEKNLAQILDAVTIIHPQADAANVFAVDDPELSKFPVAYHTRRATGS